MSITPGSRIGPYEVTSQLGEGGMGVVFRGHDARLQRDVALKLLPDSFASDPDRLSRFQREAQTLASLNHTNIAQIYGLEQVDGTTCIVMELVEGETLEDRLKRGPFSFDEALDVARQIADALAVAHERGIVHRDLKPANIKLTPNGVVKVLDFGLAKALGPKTSDSSLTAMPTMASGSMVGAIVGTPGYMSPEQARGKAVDARTDIWAFGCVLYEMLTAHQAFGGETITDIFAKIVTSPPNLDLLPKNTPPSIRLLLSSTLNKNATQRLQNIGDTRLFTDGTLSAAAAAGPAADAPSRGIRSKLLPMALLVALAVVAVPAVLYFRNSAPTALQMRFDLLLPGMIGQPLLSPDGRSIAYATQPTDGKRMLSIRSIGSETGQQLAGTENVNGALFSPDSKRLAVVAEGKLKIINLADGSSRILGDVGGVRGGTWNRNGDILMARISDNIIVKMSDAGGPITPVTTLDAGRKEVLHALPVFLDDGNRFVFVAAGTNPEETTGIFLASLDAREPPTLIVPLTVSRFNGMAYAAGHLMYLNEGKLTAQRLDSSGRPQGDPIVVADNLDASFSASNTGMLMYHKAAPTVGKQLLWFTREGKQVGQAGAVANYGNVDLSPKGDRAAVDMITNSNRDVWVVDLERSVAQPVTFDPGSDWTSSWSPDGTRLAFASTRAGNDGATKIYEKSSTGAGTETILPTDTSSIPVHWSADGKYIVFSRLRQAGNTASYDTWLLPLFGDRKATPLLETGFDKFQARVSPNSNYVAYSTNESGSYQIVVQTFPDASGGKWQISSEGGFEPKWRRDGRELYYLAPDGKLMSVSISGPAFTAGRPVELFQTPLTVNRAQPTRDRRYDVAPDGRFLMVVPSATGGATPYSVIVNWNPEPQK
jgi:Tol biopolymer transport system component